MATKGIRIPIMWKSDPRGLTDAEKRMQKFGQAARAAGAVAAAGLAVAGAAAIKFGADSVRAFAEAQEAQNRLAFAFEKFPALADTNVEAIRRLNSALMKKTRFDDDAIASGQAVLAQFGLTGDQLAKLTPLLLDYAGATGKDLTTSAEDLGRALLGQGRALKILGIDFSDAGSVAANFDQLMLGLSEKVGGFAERDAETAAGKLDILANRFGEVQEAVGGALMPALDKLIEWIEGDGLQALEGFAAWFAEDGVDALTGFIDLISQLASDGKLVPTIVTGLGMITTAQLTLNAAMSANPVGIIIASIAALATWFYWLANNFDQAQSFMLDAADNTIIFLARGSKAVFDLINNALGGIRDVINGAIGGLNDVYRALGIPVQIPLMGKLSTSFQDNLIRQSEQNLLNARNPGSGGGSPNVALADGGVVMPRAGGTLAQIGEAGEAEAVMPLSWLEGQLGGGGSTVINVTVNAGVGADGAAVGREIVSLIKRYERTSGPVFASA